jgi:hypothetical protein
MMRRGVEGEKRAISSCGSGARTKLRCGRKDGLSGRGISYSTPLAWSPPLERQARSRLSGSHLKWAKTIFSRPRSDQRQSAPSTSYTCPSCSVFSCLLQPRPSALDQDSSGTARHTPRAFNDFDPVVQPGCGISAYGTALSCRTRGAHFKILQGTMPNFLHDHGQNCRNGFLRFVKPLLARASSVIPA